MATNPKHSGGKSSAGGARKSKKGGPRTHKYGEWVMLMGPTGKTKMVYRGSS